MESTKRAGVVGVAVIVCTLVPLQSADAGCWSYTRAERSFARKVNRFRSSHGLVRLPLDPELSRVSRYHTREMIRAGSLYHTPMTVLGRRVTRWQVLGENIGKARTLRRIFRLMRSSSLHRANMLTPGLRYIGVGARRRNGRLWLTATLEGWRNPGTRLSMPNC